MNSRRAAGALLVLIGIAGAHPVRAESHAVSWSAVSTYTDGAPIESSQEISYSVVWSADPALPPAGQHELGSSIVETYATFDPDAAGMPRGQTIYFAARSTLGTGGVSSLSAPQPWTVPVLPPRVPDASSGLAISGPIGSPVPGSFELSWSAVTRYADGSPLDSGVSASYTVYWTQDPMFYPGTLRTLGEGIAATAWTFDPAASGMSAYQAVYFVVKTVLGTGAESALSEGLAWTVPCSGPAAPGMPAVARLVAGSANPYQLSWAAVSTYANGTPLGSGQSVNYRAFWTTDPALLPANLHPLGGPTAAVNVAFDPSSEGMISYQRVYFAVRSVLGTGEESSLSPELSWKVSNRGPSGPSNGRVRRNGH